jgi:glycosyl hydrolase family 81
MEARGNLQLAILKRSLRNYFLMEKSNENQPPSFIPNKQSGIVSYSLMLPKKCANCISYLRTNWITLPSSEPILNSLPAFT